MYSPLAQNGQPTEKSNPHDCEKQEEEEEEEEEGTKEFSDTSAANKAACHVVESKQLNRCITAFSSGTGLAGIVGYGYKSLLSEAFGWSLSSVVFSVVSFAVCYYMIFFHGLHKEQWKSELDFEIQEDERGEIPLQEVVPPIHMVETSLLATTFQNGSSSTNGTIEMTPHANKNAEVSGNITMQHPSTELNARKRFMLVLSLWPYTIPLFTVYAAEYMLQVRIGKKFYSIDQSGASSSQ